MTRRAAALSATVAFVLALAGPTVRAGADEFADVERAIKRGQQYLLSKQKDGGRWETSPVRVGTDNDAQSMQGSAWGGYTALATYALLASGKNFQDEQVAAAVKFLKSADIIGPYALGMRAQVWSFLPRNAETLKLFKRDADLLLNSLNTNGNAIGLWDYDDHSNRGVRIDHSASQYGMLGLWACAQAGIPIDPKLWEKLDETWRSHQTKEGGWSYDGDKFTNSPVTPSMTAAGVATLYITLEFLPTPPGLNCTGNQTDEHIENGLRWISQNFKQVDNNNYLWYGIERIGAASGRKYFGNQDWHEVGTRQLLSTQKPDGSWETQFTGASGVTDTAFALLFLARGRAPIILNKLDYGSIGSTVEATGDWNQRPRDASNVSRWIGTAFERHVGWQVVTLRQGHRELLDAPILYIAGSEPITLNEAETDSLRAFIEEGGIVLGNADCGKTAFSESFRELGKKIFPRYQFRELPARHPLFTNQQFRADRWKTPIGVEGLSNGARELMLLVPTADVAKSWQQRVDKLREHHYQFAANLYHYATDKRGSRFRGDTHLATDLGVLPAFKIKIARLDIAADSDPEPAGWRRLATLIKNEYALALDVAPLKLGGGKLSTGTGKLAHLTGSRAFELKPAQREELKRYVETGGTLVIDAAGGSSAFADSALRELGDIFGSEGAAQLKTPIPLGDPLYTNPADPIKRVGFRQAAMSSLTGDAKSPRLRGIRFNKRLGVIFSREDLSVGLVGNEVDGIIGYDPPSAIALMRNVILQASGITKKPQVKRATGPVGDGLE